MAAASEFKHNNMEIKTGIKSGTNMLINLVVLTRNLVP